MSKITELINILEEKADLILKCTTNIKKCPKTRMTKGYVETRLNTIEDYWQIFKETHDTLVKSLTKEKRSDILYFKENVYSNIEELYMDTTSDLKDTLSNFVQTAGTPTPIKQQDLNIKLPHIQLPTFTGHYDDWPTYNDIFTSLVHHNITLSKVQKLHYLKASVADEAASLLKHISVTESNYEQAWDILKQRYGNKKLIVNSLLRRLFQQPKINTPNAIQLKRLLDTTTECLSSLQNLNLPVESWDLIIIYIIVQRLDPETHKAWEEYSFHRNSEDLPTWQEMKNFLDCKFRTMELVTYTPQTKELKSYKQKTFQISTTEKICIKCKENHTLCHCEEFIKLLPDERIGFVKNKNLCYNCLLPGHPVFKCRLRISCRICGKRHHSLLHKTINGLETNYKQVEDTNIQPGPIKDNDADVAILSHMATKRSTALLATALITVKNSTGHYTVLRALIDQGSQANFISERAAQLLKVKGTPTKGTITGVGSTQTEVNLAVQLEILSRYKCNFKLNVEAYVMPSRLTTYLPSTTIADSTLTWSHLKGLKLADPTFNQPGRVDMLLGVEVYAAILKNEIIRGPPGSPCAQHTSFGWILFGKVHNDIEERKITVMHHHMDFDELLHTLWELDCDNQRKLTQEEELCENIYYENVRRDNEGRYIVKLPFKSYVILSTEGNTRDIALRRLTQLERRLQRDMKLRTEYTKVMQEYIELNHMEEVPEEELGKPSVYLPHHAVVKDTSETTKVRTVFNASSMGSNNVSINDELLVGPQLQEDMRSLVMRWRLKRVCFIADIEKMYRQILVTKQDADYQRILWRIDPNLKVKDYRLLRVTFGTASAPFLAVRTLQQVAEDEGKDFPEAARMIKEDFWMDDLLSGNDTVSEAIESARNVSDILNRGGFKLQKWSSNSIEFMKNISPTERSTLINVDMNLGGTVRTLGLSWNIGDDVLQYNLNLPEVPLTITKRSILAEIQRLFDPLGWIAPALLPGKLIIQRLWLKRLTWDEEVDSETKRDWLEMRNNLNYLKEIKIPRWLLITSDVIEDVSIHGFCDASTIAYGAVAYLRVKTYNNEYKTMLIAAKTRVAPVKPVSLPRLELCGAVLLSKLLKHISRATRIPRKQIFAWTDSTIVLSWLTGDPTRWQTFVRNRVVTVLDNIGNAWYHVQSQDNPADIASRGMLLSDLKEFSLWWNGPKWLTHEEILMSRGDNISTDLELRRTIINTNIKIDNNHNEGNYIHNQFENFNNLMELQRTIVYCKKFLNFKRSSDNISTKCFSPLELTEALETCVRLAQHNDFEHEIHDLLQGTGVSNRSVLKNLNPYLDKKGLLRVGGRLRNAEMENDAKYPMIISHKNPIATLIVSDAHLKTLHGGLQLTMNFVRSRFWIIRVKSLISATIHKCLICAKQKAKVRHQLMGDLPAARVTPTRPFLHSGVDFAGPLQILVSRGRGMKCTKGYICIFICMSTKAIHLELVGDLSTESFLGCFRRFVARRGRCSHIWSDQGTNFVGASKELAKMWQEAKLSIPEDLINILAEDGTHWHFNPPYSPNFGGLWEAGVKSIKYHLRRILDRTLTFEEMSTTLCQIEACLNSRPLCPIDHNDIDNLNVLTPGHFLIGEAPINIPEPDLSQVNVNRLSRWQHTQRILQNFWHKWKTEYLTRLQQRPKWLTIKEEFKIGEVVLIKEDHLPPGKWALGRIVDKYPGSDNICRVYSLKCCGKLIKRSISRLCKLPINE